MWWISSCFLEFWIVGYDLFSVGHPLWPILLCWQYFNLALIAAERLESVNISDTLFQLCQHVPQGHCYAVVSDAVEQQLEEVLKYFNVVVTKQDVFSRCQVSLYSSVWVHDC
jgi:hypothetical protein